MMTTKCALLAGAIALLTAAGSLAGDHLPRACAGSPAAQCCCETYTGGFCCKEVSLCGPFIPGCMCR